jgi:Ca2+-binding EF-hand superfamily protein
VHLRQFSNFSDAAITNIFSMLDTNANGGVDRKELRSAFVRSSALRQAIGQGPNFK